MMQPDFHPIIRCLDLPASRRAALAHWLALGVAATGLRGVASAQSTPGAGEASSLADQRTAVQANIDRFRRTAPDALIALAAGVKTRVAVRDLPTVDAPLVYAPTPDGPVNCYLARADDPTHGFPSLSPVVPLIGRADSGVPVAVFNMEAIYVGRTTQSFTSSAGDFLVEIGYLGLFAGDSATGSPLEEVVLPAFLGWRNADGSVASPARVAVSATDAGQPEFPFELPPVSTSLDLVSALDAALGAGVAVLQVSRAAVQEAQAGWPGELYTTEYLAAEAKTTTKLYETLSDLDLTRAAQDGYSLWTQATTPQQVAILETVPDLANTSPGQLASALPGSDVALALDQVTPEALVEFPRILAAFVAPTSTNLTT
jgi:hypothetical protein